VEARIQQLLESARSTEKELARLKAKAAASAGDDLAGSAVDIKGAKVLAAALDGAQEPRLAEQIEAARQEGLPDDVAREREALDDQDLKAFAREDRRRDGARRARTDDEHVHTLGKRKHRG
jgi:alanyl-tRNA synthetase